MKSYVSVFYPFFIDIIVERVKSAEVGCYISTVHCSIFHCAVIILLSHTVNGLLVLLNVCEKFLIEISMKINVEKWIGIRHAEVTLIGPIAVAILLI